MKLFTRKTKALVKESAPQLTIYDRAAVAQPGNRFGLLGYEAYDEMQKDSMIQSVLTLKKLAVLASDTTLEPADNTAESKKRLEFIQMCFDRMEGSALDVLNNAMDAFAKGWSIQELVLEAAQGKLWLKSIRPKDPSLFGLDIDAFGRLQGLPLRVPGETDINLPKSKFVVYMNRRSYSFAKGRSDLDAAYKHWQAKLGLLAAWKLHLEKIRLLGSCSLE